MPAAPRLRPAASFWTPPAAVAVLTLVLVLLWPHRPRRPAAASLPEPAAAFVVAESGARSHLMRPDFPIFPDGPGTSPTRSTLEDVTSEAPRRLPAPAFDGVRPPAAWTPATVAAPPNRPPDLARRPVGPVLPQLFAAATGGCEVALSPGLQRCGFAAAAVFLERLLHLRRAAGRRRTPARAGGAALRW